MIKPVWIVAVSGLSSDGSFDRQPVSAQSVEERIRTVLITFLDTAQKLNGTIEIVCGASEGVTALAVSVAESLGLAVHLILPLPIKELAEDFLHRPAAWDGTLAVIAKTGGLVDRDANEISRLCELGERKQPTKDWPPRPIAGWTFRVSEGSHERNFCYHDAATQMLDAADACITLFSPHSPEQDDYRQAIEEQAAARGIAIAKIDLSKEGVPTIDWKARRWAKDTVLDELNAVTKDLQSKFHTSSEQIAGDFAALDEFANRTGGRVKNRALKMIGLQFTATIIAVINTALLLPLVPREFKGIVFKWESALIGYQVLFALELACVSIAFLLGTASRWTNIQSKWRMSRFGAEILRSLIHTRGLVDPLYPIVGRHNPVWHRFALSGGLAAQRENPPYNFDWQTIKTAYHRDRMEHQRDAYYRKQFVGASKLSKVCGRIARWTGALAPIGLVLAMYLKVMHPAWIATSSWSPVFIQFLPILLPLLAGTSASLKVVTDADRRTERYHTQASRLESTSRWFLTLRTPSSIRRAVLVTEEILLDELIEWHAASKNTGK